MDWEQNLINEYFENNGFFVRRAGKFRSNKRKKSGDELLATAILKPSLNENSSSLGFRLYTSDLNKIRFALVCTLSWENPEFSYGMLTNDALLMKFFKKQVKENLIEECFNPSAELPEYGIGSFLRLLIVPALPKDEKKMSEVFTLFNSINVEGILTFRSILENLLRSSDPSIYSGKPILEIFKILKAYELAKDPQLEMFEG